ncbi:MAG TPA: glycosyltransferase family 4 protein [candidate division Zixibacteria bacterium]|nr:glycosyltransferase family 4 protein [candidate division Zixibacteria bacterium]
MQAGNGLFEAARSEERAALPRLLILASESGQDCLDVDKMLRINSLINDSGSCAEVIRVAPALSAGDATSRSVSTLRRSFAEFSVIRSLLRKISSFDAVFIEYTTGISFLRLVLPAILLAKFFGKKVVLNYRHYAGFARLYDGGPIQNRLFGLCDRVLVLSDFQHHRLERFRLRSGFLPEYLRAAPSEPKKIESLQPKILVAGPIEKISNLNCVLKAYRLVKQKYPRTELVIAGDGTRKRSLMALVNREKIPGVTFRSLRTLDELNELFGEADLFVNCSYLDYLPATMIEAAAHGLPIISTPSVSVLESFCEGESVLFGRHNDHVSLSDKIIELVENPQLVQKLCDHAGRVVENFRWEKVRPGWHSLLSRIAE